MSKKKTGLSQQSGHRILSILSSAQLQLFKDMIVAQFPVGTSSLSVDAMINKLKRGLEKERERLGQYGKQLEIWKDTTRFFADGRVRRYASEGPADPSKTIHFIKIRIIQKVRPKKREHLVPSKGFYATELCATLPKTSRHHKLVDEPVENSIRLLRDVPIRDEGEEGSGKYLAWLREKRQAA